MVILKYVDFELSYDQHNRNADRIFRTNNSSFTNGEFRGTSVISPYALGPSLLADVPEIKSYIRTHPMYGGAVVSYKRDKGEPSTFHEDNMQFVDSTFLDVFTYEALAGNLNTALDKPASIVITKKMADKYFGKNEDPLGKIMQVSGGWADGDYEVTAVLKNLPQNSHLSFDFLMPTHNLLQNGQYKNDNGWGWNNFITYIELATHTDIKNVEEKMPAFIDKYRGKELASSNSKNVLSFQPILAIHLSPGLKYESSATVSINTIYFFIIIAIFILAIAWINYINLSTARAMERAREVGIKKAIGAFRSQLIYQFIAESVFINFLGIVLATFIAIALLPVLGEIVGKDLTFDFSDYRFWLTLAGLFSVGSLISGIYPALVLSSFTITAVIKGNSGQTTKGFSLRKSLVVFQFASSLILIAGTFAVYRQVVFMRNQDKGLTMEQMLIVNGPSIVQPTGTKERLITLKNEIKKIAGVVNVATSGAIPGGGYNWGTEIRREGTPEAENKNGSVVWIDPDFVETYNIKVLSGRAFNPSIASDMKSVLINETSLKAFGLGDAEKALQQRIILGNDTVAILGVVKNYHWNSLKTEHTPWLFKADTVSRRDFSILLSGANFSETIKNVEHAYKAAFPGNPFDYYFLDDFFNSQYKDETQFAKIFSLFAILAIAIACLGLWGLAAFTTTQKLKEIGIRKVLGASVGSLVSMLSWQFLKLVLIASALALPLTWYGVDTWLNNFAFRIGLQWDLFVVPVVILAFLAIATISLQIIRGANINPAKILRSE